MVTLSCCSESPSHELNRKTNKRIKRRNGSPRLTCFNWQTLTIGLQLTCIQQSPLDSRPLMFVWSNVSPHRYGLKGELFRRTLKGLWLRGMVMPGLFQFHSISDFKQLWNWHSTKLFCQTNPQETSSFKKNGLSINGLESVSVFFVFWLTHTSMLPSYH